MKTNWQTKKLGEICEIIGGGTPSKANTSFYSGNIPWATVRDMKDETISTTEFMISENAVKNSSTHIIPKNNVVIATRVGLGKVCFLEKDTAINQDLRGIIPKKANEISADYLFWWFRDISGLIVKEGTGATVQGVKLLFIKSLEIPVPPLAEQKRIVKILDEVFEKLTKAKENAEKNLQNSKELFESYLNNVFANPGKDWEETTLREVCDELSAGGDVPKGNFSKHKTEKHFVPIFANGFKNKGLYGYTNIKKIERPSITVSARGTIGYAEIRKEPFYPVVRLIVLTPNEKMMDLLFLYYITHNFNFSNTGTSIPQLTIPMIENMKISLPSLKEQRVIIKKLDALSAETKKLEKIYEQKLADLEELKKSVLSKAFKGEL